MSSIDVEDVLCVGEFSGYQSYRERLNTLENHQDALIYASLIQLASHASQIHNYFLCE